VKPGNAEYISRLRTELDELNSLSYESLADFDIAGIERKITRTQRALDIASKGLYLSDHAMLRYLQRVMSIDVDTLRENMLSLLSDKFVGDGKYNMTEDIVVIIKDGVIVTMLDTNEDA